VLLRAVPVLVLVLAACRPERPSTGITVLLESPPDSLDDRLALSANGQRIAQLIAPGLIIVDDQSNVVPDLAESYRTPDPLTVEFTLRSGLTFHDGTPLTSADVVGTFEGLLDKELKSPKADKFEPIAKVEAVDPRTVRFRLKRAYAPILAELSISIVPASRARMPGARAQDRTPIGAGPFRFISQPDDEHIELAPFDGFYGGKPALSALHFRVVRDETTRVLELMKGRADLAFNVVSPAVIPMLSKQPNLRVLSKPGTGYAYVVLNTRSGPTADVRVRQAVCHAIAVDSIVEHKFHGLATPATGMLPKDHWAYEPTPGCQRDLEKAGRLLDEAGYPARAGQPRLTLTLKTSTDRFRKSIGLVFKEELAKSGIDVEVRSLEFGTLMNDMRRGNFELGTLKWAAVIEPDLLRQVFSSQFVPTQANGFGGLNRGGYSNPEVDKLLAEAATASREQREVLYAQALRIIDREVPYVPLWHESSVAVVSHRLQGFEPSTHGFLRPLAKAREVTP
jgi:peptide/nickel transport system substrate-binding protein